MRDCRHWISRASVIALAGTIAFAAAAHATSITPLYFDGPSGYGFAPAEVAALGVSATAGPSSHWILAGGRSLLPGPGLHVDNHLSTILSNPQATGGTPTAANPFVADSTWTVTNDTSAAITGAYLVFTAIDIDGRYHGALPAGLDGALLKIVDYSSAGTNYAFGAIPLPNLGVGQSADLLVRYVVAGPLDYDAETNAYVLPRLGVSGLVVPEPAAIAGIALGLALLAAGRVGSRRSRASSR
jgi:hypothetical protein